MISIPLSLLSKLLKITTWCLQNLITSPQGSWKPNFCVWTKSENSSVDWLMQWASGLDYVLQPVGVFTAQVGERAPAACSLYWLIVWIRFSLLVEEPELQTPCGQYKAAKLRSGPLYVCDQYGGLWNNNFNIGSEAKQLRTYSLALDKSLKCWSRCEPSVNGGSWPPCSFFWAKNI